MDNSLPSESGYYYLTRDVVLSDTNTITGNKDIVINLSGHTVYSAQRVYLMNVSGVQDSLTVLDSIGGGRVVLTGSSDGAAFAAVGGTGSKTVTIYGGTFDASAVTTSGNGAFLRVGSADGTLNVHGGTIIGGTASNGGAVHINAGVMNMTGGEIKDGSAGNGGNIVTANGGVLTMTGGSISGGSATAENGRGGNIFNNNSTVSISGDAEIYDGEAVELGVNVFSSGNSFSTTNTGSVYLTGSSLKGIYPASDNTLKVGYSKKSITPTAAQQSAGIEMKGGACTGFIDDIYVITTAFEDADGNRFYHIVTDLIWGGISDSNNYTTSKGVCDMVRRVLRDELSISPDLVTVGGTHNHSQVNYSSSNPVNEQWRNEVLLPQVVASVTEAIADLSPAQMYVGRTETQDLTFVRRYYLNDGSFYEGMNKRDTTVNRSDIASHETEADEEIQMIKLTRSGKQDILMINWQSHATIISSSGTKISSDFVGPLRDKVDTELGVLSVFYQGACGNLSPTSRTG
jgi:hypothetical protein